MLTEPSKDEKLRRRQEQLAKWKLKKQSISKLNSPQEATPSKDDGNTATDEQAKKLERQKKLEEWKRKKQQDLQKQHTSNAIAANVSEQTNAVKLKSFESPTLRIVPKVNKNTLVKAGTKRKMAFASDEEDEGPELKFKAPVLNENNYNQAHSAKTHDNNEVDALDAFLQELDGSSGEQRKDATLPESEVSDDEEANVGSDDDQLTALQLKAMQKGKELNAVDHDQIDYISFRKTFYVEPESIQKLSDDEVSIIRSNLDDIKVKGESCPRPILKWSQLGFPKMLLSLIEEKLGFEQPTPIQSQALPVIMSGRDMLAIAKTGSGKTLAFVIPLLRHVSDQPSLQSDEGPIALILSPTRELALQIFKQLSIFTKKLGLLACCCYGGASIEPQIAELKKGTQIVVSTPGRLIDLLTANNGRVCNLRRVTYVVLDEADRMFDFGFEPQINKIFSQIRPDKQCVLFSATFARKMESLAKNVLHNPIEVIVGGISIVPPEIRQHVILFDDSKHETEEDLYTRKLEKLVLVINDYVGVKKLVFVEKQDSADDLLLRLLKKGIKSLAIHGGKEQIDRKYAIKEFASKTSGIDILIATSVAARGLDVKGLDLVINFDPASHMEDYVHRVGRTGRAGKSGDAFTFVSTSQERAITDLVKSLLSSKVPREQIDPKLLEISEMFLLRVKEGKEKFYFGFGGKGLSKLDERRNSSKMLERKIFDSGSKSNTSNNGSSSMPPEDALIDADNIDGVQLPEFKVIEGRAAETSGPDKCKFHSRITINDLPQKARWFVVNAENMNEVIEATSTSITNKGQYYPPNTKIPTKVKQGGRDVAPAPKLYLLVEGLSESAVAEANRLIKQKMIEGLKVAFKDGASAPTGRYKV